VLDAASMLILNCGRKRARNLCAGNWFAADAVIGRPVSSP